MLLESYRLGKCFGTKVAKAHMSDSLCNLILPYVVQPPASRDVYAARVMREVVNLATIAQIVQKVRHEGCPVTHF